MKREILISLLVFIVSLGRAQHDVPVIVTPSDSLYIEKLLQTNIAAEGINGVISFYARQLHGVPYAGGTLDIRPEECLIVNVHELDCTTFVETVLALSITKLNGGYSLYDYAKTLQLIRYHNGTIDGYGSRLHYFSDWISDNEGKGLVREITSEHLADSLPLQLYFMSANADKYPLLKGNPAETNKIREYETRLSGGNVFYIPKEKLHSTDLTWIREGDIIAITTGRPGLDVTHVGFAHVANGEIYLMHASLKEQKVVTALVPLATYLSRYSSQTGIRVIRVLPPAL